MAKKQYMKVVTEIVKIDTENVLMNEISGANQPWAAKQETSIIDDDFNEETNE